MKSPARLPSKEYAAGQAGLESAESRPAGTALPLATLLQHCAAAVGAVRSGVSLNDALERCPGPARPGTQALTFHVLRWLGSAQTARALLAQRAPPPQVDALLLSALALLWPTPAAAPYTEHTLVDQAVAAARQSVPRGASFINAVLRRFLRERDAIRAVALREPLARFNHPPWWVDVLAQDWPQESHAILDANNQHAPMDLRVNLRHGTVMGYLARLADQGLAASPAAGACVRMARPCPVSRLPGFAQGDVSVQDAAAQLAAPLLLGTGLPVGARVLDACAAPGGKTAHLLELADLDITALDQDGARLQRVVQSLDRLGLRAATLQADAGAPSGWWSGEPYDAILLDAPCSASGIVRRHPDVRWLRRASDIDSLVATQTRLLEALWPLLRPAGHLLYCTCSVFRAEGQSQIDAFMQRCRDGRRVERPPSTGHLLPLPDNAGTPILPTQTSPGDGFFYALLEKLAT